jgi:HEAT repeat protein
MKKILVALFVVAFSSAAVFAADAPADRKTPDKNAKQYIEDLSSPDEATVIAAEDWLGQQTERGATVKLLDLLKTDQRVRVRMYSAVALGLIADKDTAEPISGFLLSEQSADVRYSMVLAIMRIGGGSQQTISNLTAAREKENDPFIKDFVTKMEAKYSKK